ncbi:MAG: glycosyltransferase family 2 protein [Deltaproteobacteria bacterium]|nr:glycosyltransferase family 2 protein [Deltaproteobacteria bacterium]
MNSNPEILLSICIPTYNRAFMLRECLDSVIESIKDFESEIEIIISDNASMDGTDKMVRAYLISFPFITYYRNEENIGAERNVRSLTKRVAGKYIWILGDDDKVTKNAIGIIMQYIKLNYDLVINNYSVWSKDFSKLIKNFFFRIQSEETFSNPNDILSKFGIHLGYVSSLVFKKSCFIKRPDKEYDFFLDYGYPQVYAAYYGLFPKCNVIYNPIPVVCNRGNNSGGYDWYKYNVIGMSLILNKLKYIGYTLKAVNKAQCRIIKEFVVHDILVKIRDNKSTNGLFVLMFPYYKKYFIFWGVCVPLLLIPKAPISFIYKFIKSRVVKIK